MNADNKKDQLTINNEQLFKKWEAAPLESLRDSFVAQVMLNLQAKHE